MTTPQAVALAIALTAVFAGILWTSVKMVGQVAERFGEDPRPWQLRMLPFHAFGPFLLWWILSRRGGGGRGGFA